MAKSPDPRHWSMRPLRVHLPMARRKAARSRLLLGAFTLGVALAGYFCYQATLLRVPDRFVKRALEVLPREARMRRTGKLPLSYDALLDLVVSARHPEPACVVQLGSNRGHQIDYGWERNDPVLKVVRHSGTRGLLIEPLPQSYDAVLNGTASYANRHRVVHAAVAVADSDSPEPVPFYAIHADRVLAEFKSAPTWFLHESGSFKKEGLLRSIKLFEHHWTPRRELDYYVRVVTVHTISVHDVVQLLQSWFPQCSAGIDYLRIDVEGFNWPIAKRFLEISAPNVLIFQRRYLPREQQLDARATLARLGYFSWERLQNMFSIRLAPRRSR